MIFMGEGDLLGMTLAVQLYIAHRADAERVLGIPTLLLDLPPRVDGGRCAYCGGADPRCSACGAPLGEGERV